MDVVTLPRAEFDKLLSFLTLIARQSVLPVHLRNMAYTAKKSLESYVPKPIETVVK